MSQLKKRAWLPSDMRLAEQDVAPERADWFARTRLNVIDWYPQTMLNLVCVGLMSLLAGPDLGLGFCVAVLVFGLTPTIGVHVLYWRARKAPSIDHVKVLRGRAALAVVNALGWAIVLGWALAITNGFVFAAILALSLYRLMMTGVICFSIPFVGTLNLFLLTCGIGAGLIVNGGWAGLAISVVVALAAHSFYSVSFNLYYMFATRRLRTRTLREANETVELLLHDYDQQGSDWLWETDATGKIVSPSPRFADATGICSAELAGTELSSLFIEGGNRDALCTAVAKSEAIRNLEVGLMQSGEKPVWWSVSGRPLLNSQGALIGYRGFAADISATKESEAKVTHLALFDQLTGLPNRAQFTNALKRALTKRRHKSQVAVLFVDLDHFKSVNDGYGHIIGDNVLELAARRIEACLGVKDLAARLGGDEFAIVLPNVECKTSAINLANKLVEAMEQGMDVDRLQLSVGCSVGIAFAPDDAERFDHLLRNADLALYHSKDRGRACVSIYDRDMHEAMQHRRQLETDLRAALGRGELELYYQPLVSIEDRMIQGYEALLRWNHPKNGLVSPADFIPVAEETGLIVPIGEWVIRTALEELKYWPEQLSVAVNLSPIQIRNDNLLPTLISALATSGVNPRRLEMEITESVLLHDSEENVAILHKIRDLGVKISLDDFGTGYSSLNYLRSFPFDKIKIDRSFVDGLETRPDCQAIVDAVVGLAANLEMATTAEGVESDAQLEELKRNGCKQAQGYLFSRAVPASALPYDRPAKIDNVQPIKSNELNSASGRGIVTPPQQKYG